MSETLFYYGRIWQRQLSLSMGTIFSNKLEGLCYWLGKLIRFLFFILLLTSLFHHTRDFLGYSMPEMVLIFLTFNLIDVLSQVFFRGLYGFGNEVNRGLFDFVLIRPASALFLVMTRIIDVLDIVFLIPILLGFALIFPMLTVTLSGILAFAWLLITGIVITTALHIFMAALIVRMRDDTIIMLFRLLGRFAMFPQETYHEAIRFIFIFLFPVFTMMVFPGQALVGKLDPIWLGVAGVIASIFFFLSLSFWQRMLRLYSSASS